MRKLPLLIFLLAFSLSSSAESIKVGVVAPLSGEFSIMGRDFVDALHLAAQDLASQNRPKFDLVVEDDVFQPAKGLTAIKKLLEVDQVQALINLSTPTMNAAYQILKNRNMPVLQLGLFDKSNQRDNIFMMQPEITKPLEEYAEYVRAQTGGAALDLFYFEDASVLTYVNTFARAYGGKVNAVAVPQITSLPALVLKSSAKNPKYAAMGLTPEFGAELLKQYLRLNQRPQIFSLCCLEVGSSEYRRQINELEYLQSLCFLTPRDRVSERFLADFKKKYSRDPQPFTENGYDALLVLAQTYDQVPSKWVEKVSSFSGEGVSGKVSFNPAGERSGVTRVMRFGELQAN